MKLEWTRKLVATVAAAIAAVILGALPAPAFALRLAHKDVTLATQLGRELKVPMHMANLALDELTEAMNRGWENRDSRVAMLLQQERAGVKIEVPEAELKAAIERDGKV